MLLVVYPLVQLIAPARMRDVLAPKLRSDLMLCLLIVIFLLFCSLSVSLIRKKNSVDRPLVVFGDALLNLVSGDSIAVLIHGIGGRRDTDSLCNFRLCTAPSELYEAVCDFLIIQVFTSLCDISIVPKWEWWDSNPQSTENIQKPYALTD